MTTKTFSSASNAKRAAAAAGVPGDMIEVGKQADGRWYYVDMTAEEARADAILAPLDAPKAKKPRKAKDAPKAEPKPRKEPKAKAEKAPKGESKQDRLIALLKRPEGASVTELVAEFGWAAHTVRGAVAGALKRKLGLDVGATKDAERGGTVYRIASPSKGE